jgi:hypothetical protein
LIYITNYGALMMFNVVLTIGFIGLLLLGSEGAYYPLLNFVGLILLICAILACCAYRRCRWEILGLLARMQRNKK